MQIILKSVAIVLTIALLALMYGAISANIFSHTQFWLVYILILLADIGCISFLKRMQQEKDR